MLEPPTAALLTLTLFLVVPGIISATYTSLGLAPRGSDGRGQLSRRK